MRVGIIGNGAISGYVQTQLQERGYRIDALLVRSAAAPAKASSAMPHVESVDDLPQGIELMIDCAGHGGLQAHGAEILRRGTDLITVSLGALADAGLQETLEAAARSGASRLHLASGAIGALDCLQAARIGGIDDVTYIGRKPPQGWKGSPAETIVDLDGMRAGAQTHFSGSAREAAVAYPKNANVAAAVALAGIGFEQTRVELIADAEISTNIHQISAAGAFGNFEFVINGNPMPDSARSSALAAMSVVSKLDQLSQPIRF
ncbi:MAG: aspartate dehydrogenase [Pseudomonadota bacterium]